MRIDKWLWAVRIYKTRSLAKNAINGGKVFINGYKAKCSKYLCIGDVLEITYHQEKKVLIVDQFIDHRKSAKEVLNCYHETEESIKKRKLATMQRKIAIGVQYPVKRPDKKQRRQHLKFKKMNYD